MKLFVQTCLRQWLEQSTSESYKCPMCRAPLIPTGEEHQRQQEGNDSRERNHTQTTGANGNEAHNGRVRWEQLLRQRFQENLGHTGIPTRQGMNKALILLMHSIRAYVLRVFRWLE